MNCNTQNEKIADITEKTLVIGIDIGSESHFARAFDYRGIEYTKKAFEFSNTEAGFGEFKAWADDIAIKNGKDKLIAGMEPTGHYWFNLGRFLQNVGVQPVLVNPHHVKKSKELDDNNPTKNDRKDPKVIAGLVKDGRYSCPYIPEGVYSELRNISNMRMQYDSELTRIKNRMARWVNIYFPEYKDVYGNMDAVSGIMILKIAPLPEDIVDLGIEGVNKVWRNAKLRGVGIKRAKSLVEAAEHSIGTKEGANAARMEIRNLMDDYDMYSKRVGDCMSMMEELLNQIPYVDKLLAIKGVGLKTVTGFIAEIGNINRFDNPKQLQKYAGFAIKENSSGKHKGETTINRRGRKRLRYLLFEVAMSLVSKNQDFREIHQYFTTRADNPLKKMQSLIAVACKLIRVFYAIMTKGVDYDGQKMLSDIKRPEKVAIAA